MLGVTFVFDTSLKWQKFPAALVWWCLLAVAICTGTW